jgi:hypothetical protein
VYLDHNVIADESKWPFIRQIVSPAHRLRLATSEWELLEIAQGTDRCQAIRRAEFIESLEPHWLVDRLHLQRLEIQNFLFNHFWSKGPQTFDALTPSFAVMMSYVAGPQVPIGWRPKQLVECLFDNHTLRDQMLDQKMKTVDAISTLQQAGKQKRRQSEVEVFKAWLTGMLPDVDPDGVLLTKTGRAELLAYCCNNREMLYQECCSLAVEKALSEIRARDPRRHPKQQDAIDLQHAVIALAYCNFFVTKERYLRHCASEAAKLLPTDKIAKCCSLAGL